MTLYYLQSRSFGELLLVHLKRNIVEPFRLKDKQAESCEPTRHHLKNPLMQAYSFEGLCIWYI